MERVPEESLGGGGFGRPLRHLHWHDRERGARLSVGGPVGQSLCLTPGCEEGSVTALGSLDVLGTRGTVPAAGVPAGEASERCRRSTAAAPAGAALRKWGGPAGADASARWWGVGISAPRAAFTCSRKLTSVLGC